MNQGRKFTVRARLLAAMAMMLMAGWAWSAPNLAEGKRQFGAVCSSCHGAAAQGNEALRAPPLAGQNAPYIVRQFSHFKSGVRSGPQGSPTALMQAVAAGSVDMEMVRTIAAYLETVKPTVSRPSGPQPVYVRGQYGVCVGCHNAQGEGNLALGSARINILPEWYLVEQMQAFRDGRRGTHEQDVHGRQMVSIMRDMPEDELIRDLARYIQYLDRKVTAK